MKKQIVKKSKIEIEIGLNEDKHPESIHWKSDDNPEGQNYTECKAMMLVLFDKEYKDTFKIDLWTTEMQVVEMDRFIFQHLKSLTDTYFRATGNNKLASEMQMLGKKQASYKM